MLDMIQTGVCAQSCRLFADVPGDFGERGIYTAFRAVNGRVILVFLKVSGLPNYPLN
jgi:hypothetical protein